MQTFPSAPSGCGWREQHVTAAERAVAIDGQFKAWFKGNDRVIICIAKYGAFHGFHVSCSPATRAHELLKVFGLDPEAASSSFQLERGTHFLFPFATK